MSLSSSRARLHGAFKELCAQWDQVRLKWDDPQSRDFRKRYLDPLEPRLRNAISTMEKMDEVLARARRECG